MAIPFIEADSIRIRVRQALRYDEVKVYVNGDSGENEVVVEYEKLTLHDYQLSEISEASKGWTVSFKNKDGKNLIIIW